MSFLDALFDKQKKSAPAAKAEVFPDAFPDKPQPFGYKTSWLCIKGATPEQVISALGLNNAVPANWASGLTESRNKVFVSPVVKGYVLVIGYETFGVMPSVDMELEALGNIAKNFKEVQCFANHSVVEFYTWAKFVNGGLVRGYGWAGDQWDVYLNKGGMTPEEKELDFDHFVQGDEEVWEEGIDLPDMESVIDIAAAWGVDPMFSDGEYECGVGYICNE